MEYFCGFQWPVRTAFSRALEGCRFEAGDMLYSDREAYEMRWGDAMKVLNHSIQIAYPPRKNAASSGDESSFFTSNWKSEVRLDWWSVQDDRRKRITTTQGNLYSALWKGSIDLLFEECPEPPLLAGELHKRLEDCSGELSAVRSDLASTLFVTANDTASSLLRGKLERLRSAFESLDYRSVSPQDLKALDGLSFCPTVELCVFELPLSSEDVEARVKAALYVPLKNKITDREAFYVHKHGLIV